MHGVPGTPAVQLLGRSRCKGIGAQELVRLEGLKPIQVAGSALFTLHATTQGVVRECHSAHSRATLATWVQQ